MFPELRILLAKRKEYRRNALMTPEQFRDMKLAKFRALVRHAVAKAPYYTQLVRERGIDPTVCEPGDFPPLTKSLLMQNFDAIATDPRVRKQDIVDFLSRSTDPADMFRDEFRVIHTSGSSGEVGYFVYSKADWTRGIAGMMRPQQPQPERAAPRTRKGGRFRLAFYGAVGGHYAAVTMMSAMQRGIGRFFVKVGLFEVNSPLAQTVEQLNAFQPDVLSGYTGALVMLARKQQEGLLRIAPRAVSTAGEGMSMTDKTVLEAAFGCEARNGYGSSEHLMMGVAQPDNATMLLPDDELIYEPAEDHTLVTNLFNYTLPLIKYRMADILRPVARKTAPASPYLEVESVVGRTENMPFFVNESGAEDCINPITIVEIFVAGVQRFQLQWLDKQSFDFLVCLDPALAPAQQADAIEGVTRRLQEILAQKLLRNVRFRVVPVADIPVNPNTRKFQLIVDLRSSSAR
jgi:phenylacetate-coenzyme A ligase PaaK-like adenylate-forming protein